MAAHVYTEVAPHLFEARTEEGHYLYLPEHNIEQPTQVVLAADYERELAEQLAERDRRIAELEQGLRWACDQLIYYLPKPLDTEASRVFDEARALLERVRKEDSCQN
jgi:hypothetical protein